MERRDRSSHLKIVGNNEISNRDRSVAPPFWEMRLEVLLMHKTNKFSEYANAIGEIKKMARGEQVDQMIRQYYPNWEKNDFINLLKALGEEID